MAGAISKSTDPFTKSKRNTYEGFSRFTFWGTVIVISIVGLMAVFLL